MWPEVAKFLTAFTNITQVWAQISNRISDSLAQLQSETAANWDQTLGKESAERKDLHPEEKL